MIQILSASVSEKTPLLSAEESDSSDPLTSMLSALEPGEKILHYEIIDAIGEGGMGEVYKAQDLKLGRTVAIKDHTREQEPAQKPNFIPASMPS